MWENDDVRCLMSDVMADSLGADEFAAAKIVKNFERQSSEA
jgi:hypothetical protein